MEHVPYMSGKTTYDSTGLNIPTSQVHRHALRLYDRAIASVRQLTKSHQMDDSFVVLSYILFASVEFQQRNVKTGNDLVKRCCQTLIKNLTSLDTRQNWTAGQVVLQVLPSFVLKKGILISTFGNALPPKWAANEEVDNMFKAVLSRSPTLNEARVQFRTLVYDSYELLRLADFFPLFKDDHPERVAFSSQRQSLLTKLMKWKVSMTAVRSGTSDVESDWIRSYLLLYWAVCYTSLAACISTQQTIFDDYMDHFADMVEHATVYVRHSAQSTNIQLLSGFDPGVVPLLYFCATKCRDPTLRREALRLMRLALQQEEPWAFVAPDRVAAKLIAVEEGEDDLCYSKHPPGSQYAGLPPEERRFAYVSVVSRQAPSSRPRLALEMSRFEFATDGSRRTITDYAWLDEGVEVRPGAYFESRGMATRYGDVPSSVLDPVLPTRGGT
ncbi:hypothetical protein A1O3_07548 [Capronia epimyces CBS 606.96]|uniref:Uncharacterized protein n=1 Tax=Capronia epimyces CBS 606.96 TaxID=1182542 RepID=W9XM03_9EURO|nr:uncharacterized protein A1O3_07548 [Capronia epimyces CBS 606.96]EXJ81258.1 hypothetical protein A1O3_07548 [Capronia epimyces CBS 606.96]